MMMKRRARVPVLALGLACAASSLAPRAAGQASLATEVGPSDVELAETYAAEAFAAYQVRDYGRAVMLYERALAAAPSPDIVYNIARVYDVGLMNWRLAIEYYERYVGEAGATSSRVEMVSQRLEELRAAERASGGVRRDDVDAIAREFPLDVPEVEPAPAPIRLVMRPRPAPRNVGLRPLQLGAIALGSAGLAGVAVGVGFGLAARARTDTWQRDCDGNVCISQRGVDAAESAERRARVATMGFAAGGSLLAVAGVFWLIDADDERSGDAWALRVAPMADGSSVGGRIEGRF